LPSDDLDYVAHPRHLDLIVQKVQEKLTGKDEVIFAEDELKPGFFDLPRSDAIACVNVPL
jgi:hypothetical protein